MGIKFESSSQSKWEHPDIFMALLRPKLEAAMHTVILDAVQNMRRFTEGRKNEVTGDMLADIAGSSFLVGADRVVGEFGFPGRQQLYYALQTSTGFNHYPDGNFIEPSFALRDSELLAIEKLLGLLKATI